MIRNLYRISFVFVLIGVSFCSCNKEELPDITEFLDPRDGNSYWAGTIGKQVWMRQNLRFMPEVFPGDRVSDTEARYYVYGHYSFQLELAKEEADFALHGTLYNWQAALTACPKGWHLPTAKEWTQFKRFLGKDAYPNLTGKTFCLTSGGFLENKKFKRDGRYESYFWTADEIDSQQVISIHIYHKEYYFSGTRGHIDHIQSQKNYGYPIRCIMD